MIINESFQVVIIIKKLSPYWNEIGNWFKHKSKKIEVEDLILRLRVKEDNKLFEIRVISYNIIHKEKPYTKRISIAKSLIANIFL
jgi:hypothetical protein